jgi:hypothetical protein
MRRSPVGPVLVLLALLAGPASAHAAKTVAGERTSQWLVELEGAPGARTTTLNAEHRRFRAEAEDAGVRS